MFAPPTTLLLCRPARTLGISSATLQKARFSGKKHIFVFPFISLILCFFVSIHESIIQYTCTVLLCSFQYYSLLFCLFSIRSVFSSQIITKNIPPPLFCSILLHPCLVKRRIYSPHEQRTHGVFVFILLPLPTPYLSQALPPVVQIILVSQKYLCT